MKLNRDIDRGYHFLTDGGIVLRNYGNMGIGDSLGRTARAALIYDEDEKELIEGIKSFFGSIKTSPLRGEEIYVTRYPGNNPWTYARGNSRDHVTKAITVLWLKGEKEFVKNFIKNRARRPSINKGYTLFQKLWFYTLESNFLSWVYVIIKTPELLFRLLTNIIFRTLSWSWKTYKDPEEFCKVYTDGTAYKHQNSWVKFWGSELWLLPMYAIFYTTFCLHAMKSNSARRYLQKILLLFIEKENHYLRYLAGDTRYIKSGYIPSKKGRWTMRLDRLCDRNMTPSDYTPDTNLEDAEYLFLLKLKQDERRDY